jgi:hypothetical protein
MQSRPALVCLQAVDLAKAPTIVNTKMVNARFVCLNRADFCVFLPVLGRFLYFSNTIKYNGKLPVNLRNALNLANQALTAGKISP